MVETAKGVGAWMVPGYYSGKMTNAGDERVRFVVVGIQNELVRLRLLPAPTVPFTGGFGIKTDLAVRAFQASADLGPDGVFGPKTSRMFWNPHFLKWENEYDIPGRLLFGQASAESGLDPGAQGFDTPEDRGICQFNRPAHPDMTDEICYGNPPMCIGRAAGMFNDARATAARISGKPLDSRLVIDCAVAAHNSPALSQRWARDGKPPYVAARTQQIADYVMAVRTAAGDAP